MWSFSRDNGFPFSSYLSRVAPAPYNVPLWAHIFSTFWIAVLGFLYLISTSAFGSLVTGCILMQYVSYSIPVVLLMLQNRKLSNPGPFRLGRWGWLANGILVGWALFTLVFYNFPFVMPVTGGNMSTYPSPFFGVCSDEFAGRLCFCGYGDYICVCNCVLGFVGQGNLHGGQEN